MQLLSIVVRHDNTKTFNSNHRKTLSSGSVFLFHTRIRGVLLIIFFIDATLGKRVTSYVN